MIQCQHLFSMEKQNIITSKPDISLVPLHLINFLTQETLNLLWVLFVENVMTLKKPVGAVA